MNISSTQSNIGTAECQSTFIKENHSLSATQKSLNVQGPKNDNIQKGCPSTTDSDPLAKRSLFQLHNPTVTNDTAEEVRPNVIRNSFFSESSNPFPSLLEASAATASISTPSTGGSAESMTQPFLNSTQGTEASSLDSVHISPSTTMNRLASDMVDNTSFLLTAAAVQSGGGNHPFFVTDSPTTSNALLGAGNPLNPSNYKYICPSPSLTARVMSKGSGGISPCLQANSSITERFFDEFGVGDSKTHSHLLSLLHLAESFTPTTVQNGLSASAMTGTPRTTEGKPTPPTDRTSCDPSPIRLAIHPSSSESKSLAGFRLPPAVADSVRLYVQDEEGTEPNVNKRLESFSSPTPPPQPLDVSSPNAPTSESGAPSVNDFALCADDVDDEDGDLISLLPSAASGINNIGSGLHDFGPPANDDGLEGVEALAPTADQQLLSPPILEGDQSDIMFMSPNSSFANAFSNESYRSPQLLCPSKVSLGPATKIVPFESVPARSDLEAQRAAVAAFKAANAAKFHEKMAAEASLCDAHSMIGLQLFVNEAHRQHTAAEIRRIVAKQQAKINGCGSRDSSLDGSPVPIRRLFSDCEKYKNSLSSLGLLGDSSPSQRSRSLDEESTKPLQALNVAAETETNQTNLPMPLSPRSLSKTASSPTKSIAASLKPTVNAWCELQRLLCVDLAVGGYNTGNKLSSSPSALLTTGSPIPGYSTLSTPLSKGGQFLLSDSFTLGGSSDFSTPKKKTVDSNDFEDKNEEEESTSDSKSTSPSSGFLSPSASSTRSSTPRSATHTFLLRRINSMSIFRHGLKAKHLSYDDHEYERVARAEILRYSIELLAEQKKERNDSLFLDEQRLRRLQAMRSASKPPGGSKSAAKCNASLGFPSPSSSLSVPIQARHSPQPSFAGHFSLYSPQRNDDSESRKPTPNDRVEVALEAPKQPNNTGTLLAWDILDGDDDNIPSIDPNSCTMPPKKQTQEVTFPSKARSPTNSAAFLSEAPNCGSTAANQLYDLLKGPFQKTAPNPMLFVNTVCNVGTLPAEDGYFCPPQGGDGNLMFELQGDGSVMEVSMQEGSLSSRMQAGLGDSLHGPHNPLLGDLMHLAGQSQPPNPHSRLLGEPSSNFDCFDI